MDGASQAGGDQWVSGSGVGAHGPVERSILRYSEVARPTSATWAEATAHLEELVLQQLRCAGAVARVLLQAARDQVAHALQGGWGGVNHSWAEFAHGV